MSDVKTDFMSNNLNPGIHSEFMNKCVYMLLNCYFIYKIIVLVYSGIKTDFITEIVDIGLNTDFIHKKLILE